MSRKFLLVSGIISSMFYIAANIVGPMCWEGYSSASLSVSELSAIDAPSRQCVMPLFFAYSVFALAFGFGVVQSARGARALRIAGFALIAIGVLDLLAPLFTMHLREVLAQGGASLTDRMHIILTSVTVFFILLAMGFGAAALDKPFRIYSLATIAVMMVFGLLAGLDGSRLEANLPTPMLGVWERINIGSYLLWQVMLAVVLMRVDGAVSNARPSLHG